MLALGRFVAPAPAPDSGPVPQPAPVPADAPAVPPTPSPAPESTTSDPKPGPKPGLRPGSEPRSSSANTLEPGRAPTGPSTEGAQPPDSDPTGAVQGRTALSRILPCGVQAIAVRDDTLPVASVVLAVETGTEDDPAKLPGLVHALAYHLDQGNRELPPGGPTELVNNAGGVAGLAVGNAQVRFESVVPVSQLEATIGMEAIRLRAPSVSEALWLSSLRNARKDRRSKRFLPFEILAQVHGIPGLAHDGRAVDASLANLKVEQVGAELAKRFTYTRATLVVVAPAEPSTTLATINRAFSDLPASPRSVPNRDRIPVDWAGGQGPRPLQVKGQEGKILAWPVSADPSAVAWATALCRTYNRQQRVPAESRKTRIRCHLETDPRRPTLVLWTRGTEDGTAVVTRRLDRISRGRDARLLKAQRDIVIRRTRQALATPLELARSLARLPPQQGAAGPAAILEIESATGLSALNDEPTRHVLDLLTLDRAVRLDPPGTDQEPGTPSLGKPAPAKPEGTP